MNTKQKKALYESIMKSVAKTVKNNLNEMAKHTDKNLNNSIIKELSIIGAKYNMDIYDPMFIKTLERCFVEHLKKGGTNSITLPTELKNIIIGTQKRIIENCIADSGPLEWYYNDLIYDDGLPYLGEDYLRDSELYDYFMDNNNGEFDNCENFTDVWDLLDDNMKQQISKVANDFTLKYFKGNTNVDYTDYV